jgi:hypothetical protein
MLGGILAARGVGLGPSLVRLGLVVGLVIALVSIVAQGRQGLPTEAPVDSMAAMPTASDKHTPKSASSLPKPGAESDLRTRLDVGFTTQPSNDPDYLAAAKLIIPPPPQTDLALQGVDPRRLRASFQRGVTAMRSDAAGQSATGARLVSVAAILGYQPARVLIAQHYPSSATLRSTVSSTESLRYSLDPLLTPGSQSEGNRNFLVLLAAYFSGHQALSHYANDLLAVLGDDQRFQTGERLELLLNLLARVRGACTAIAMAVVKARMITGPECSSGLQSQIANYLKATPRPGLEVESRRQALQFLDNAVDNTPAGD